MKKDIALIGGLFIIIVALLFFGQGFTSSGLIRPPRQNQATQTASLDEQFVVKIKSFTLNAAVADSRDEHRKGLSGRDGLPLDWALLFVFNEAKPHAIWMKDMKFAIDIIWIDSNKKIVDIVQNAAPEPGKKDSELTIYRPRSAAKYVLEINAGLSSLNNIQVGDSVEF